MKKFARAIRTIALATFAATPLPMAATAQAPSQIDLQVSVARAVVPVPTEVKGIVTESCTWARDASALLCGFDLGSQGVQVGSIRPDGTGFQCLTCGAKLAGEPWRLYAFPDGKRFFVGTLPNVGGAAASSGADITPQIGECTPSLLDCRQVAMRHVLLPKIDGSINDREPRISPDGKRYLWTMVRADGLLILMGDLGATSSGHYQVSDVRVLNPVSNPRSAAEWAHRLAYHEGKQFNRGDRLLLSSTRLGAGHLNVFEVDLATGSTTRVTRSLEWDQDAQYDPSRHYLIVSSARRMHNQLRSIALADIPPFTDAVSSLLVARASLSTTHARRHVSQLWLTTVELERAGRDGVMINDRGGTYTGQPTSSPWSPDGTRAAWGERAVDDRTQLVVATFPGLAKQPLACADPDQDPSCQTPTPTWAPLVSDYPMLKLGEHRIAGPRGGSASVSFGGLTGNDNRVTFSGFTDAEGRVLDGTIAINGAVLGTSEITLTQQITISGSRSGRATVGISGQGTTVCGDAETTLDGRTLRTKVGQWNPACKIRQPSICPTGADADATETGDCSKDEDVPAPWQAPVH